MTHLDALEAESVFIMREVAAEFERPVVLFSGGKDSIVLLRLAEKAFRPARFPFPVMHIDTGHNFPEVLEFRDRRVAELGERLIVASVQESIDKGRVQRGAGQPVAQPAADHDPARRHPGAPVRRRLRRRPARRGEGTRQGAHLLVPRRVRAVGAARRSGRSCGTCTTAGIRKGQHMRVFPISNWTEMDVWQYIQREDLEVPAIYFAHERDVFQRDGMWLVDERVPAPRARRGRSSA